MMVAAQFKVDPAEFAGRRVLVTGARDVLVGCPVDIQVARQPST